MTMIARSIPESTYHRPLTGRDRIIAATQDGYLDPQEVVEMMARWMTSDEIYDMCDMHDINLARILGD